MLKYIIQITFFSFKIYKVTFHKARMQIPVGSNFWIRIGGSKYNAFGSINLNRNTRWKLVTNGSTLSDTVIPSRSAMLRWRSDSLLLLTRPVDVGTAAASPPWRSRDVVAAAGTRGGWELTAPSLVLAPLAVVDSAGEFSLSWIKKKCSEYWSSFIGQAALNLGTLVFTHHAGTWRLAAVDDWCRLASLGFCTVINDHRDQKYSTIARYSRHRSPTLTVPVPTKY